MVRYEDTDGKFQLPDLDVSNLNFLKRRDLFLTEDKTEFSTKLVGFNGRLHLDVGSS